MEDDTGKNGRRWYDANKVIWGLFGAFSFIVAAAVTAIFAHLSVLDRDVARSEADRARIEQKVDDIKQDVKEAREDIKDIKNRRNP